MSKPALQVAQRSRIPLTSEEVTSLVYLGIGGQTFWVTFDTGSSDLWVVSTECNTPDCQGVVKYSPEKSHTLNLSSVPFKLEYLLGSASGTFGTETITLGSYKITSQTFALANRTDHLDLVHTRNSGFLGLAFPSLSAFQQSTGGTTVLDNIFGQLSDSNRFFAFKLGRYSATGISSSSSFTIGELDPLIVNDISQMLFFPVFRMRDGPYDFWKLPIRAITINSQPLPLSRTAIRGADAPIGILDSGTTLILGPSNDVEAFWNAVGTGNTVRYIPQSQIWQVRCNRAVDVRIEFGKGGHTNDFALHPEDIVWEESNSGDGWCIGGLQATDKLHSGDWILGDVFLKNVYVVHQGATSKKPPMIGLLGLTDPKTSQSEFQSVRGPDPAPAPSIPPFPHSNHPRSFIFASIAGVAGGLVISVLVTIIYKMRRARTERAKA